MLTGKPPKKNWWRGKTPREIVQFQLYEERFWLPSVGDFLDALSKALDRPVHMHELAEPERLREEFEGKRAPPTLEELQANFNRLLGGSSKAKDRVIIAVHAADVQPITKTENK